LLRAVDVVCADAEIRRSWRVCGAFV